MSVWLSSSVQCILDWRDAAYARNLEWKVMKGSRWKHPGDLSRGRAFLWTARVY